MHTSRAAFSLAELMIAIAIIGIVATGAMWTPQLLLTTVSADALANKLIIQLDALRYNNITGKQGRNSFVIN